MTSVGPQPTAPVGGCFLTCIAGPDRGKRAAITAAALLLGSAPDCNLLSDDPDVGPQFAELLLDGDQIRVKAVAGGTIYVDGHAAPEAALRPGQQVRIGRSLWRADGATASAVSAAGALNFIDHLGDRLATAAGVERARDWSPREMFSDVTRRRGDDEIEAHFTVGTSTTTPPLSAVETGWPKPWVFFRVFSAAVVIYIGFVLAWNQFQNLYLIPGLIMTGSVAIPFALLIFFFEVNVPRNISLYQVIKLLVAGGLLSIVLSLFGYQWTGVNGNWATAFGAGIIEETGKALALLLVIRRPKYRWTLNGLLLGATVGTGFAIFESAGYALSAALDTSAEAMREVILQRGVLSTLGGHVLWTGLVGAALWRVRGDQPFSLEMVKDKRFLHVFGICVGMHIIWDAPVDLPFYGKYIILGFAAWLLVLGFIQDGLKQIRTAQAAAAA